jgi:hypothetical protein
MAETASNKEAWYHHFWPWFIILLLVYVAITGGITMWLAFTNDDSLVNDNYYREGLAINRVIAQDQYAEKLSLSAQLSIKQQNGHVSLTLHPSNIDDDKLQLRFIHKIQAKKDFSIVLQAVGESRYEGLLETPLRNRWYLRLEPLGNAAPGAEKTALWRLNGEANFNERLVKVKL